MSFLIRANGYLYKSCVQAIFYRARHLTLQRKRARALIGGVTSQLQDVRASHNVTNTGYVTLFCFHMIEIGILKILYKHWTYDTY